MNIKKDQPEFILQHGWGLSSSCWRRWKERLEKDYKVTLPDRGYFGSQKRIKNFKTKSKKILVSHSFGLFLFEKSVLEQADFIVIISGFTKFHPEEAREARRSRLLMKFMQKKLYLEPEKLLTDFYNGHDLRGDFDLNPDVSLLFKDLERINSEAPDLESIRKIKNILIVHGKKDMVVPFSRGVYLKNYFSGAKMIEFENGDHALPFIYQDKIIEQIIDFLGIKEK
ncbi:MAG: alpha/beta hydrolase [Desulforegulaceae bacterium]|nr:alpha/beta hydrolase [Desulforegulaceae bacterium]